MLIIFYEKYGMVVNFKDGNKSYIVNSINSSEYSDESFDNRTYYIYNENGNNSWTIFKKNLSNNHLYDAYIKINRTDDNLLNEIKQKITNIKICLLYSSHKDSIKPKILSNLNLNLQVKQLKVTKNKVDTTIKFSQRSLPKGRDISTIIIDKLKEYYEILYERFLNFSTNTNDLQLVEPSIIQKSLYYNKTLKRLFLYLHIYDNENIWVLSDNIYNFLGIK